MNEIREGLRRFVQESLLFGQEIAFADEDSFLERGLIDSTGVLELVAFLEGRYQFHVEDDELVPENLDSIRNLVRFIETKTQASPAATGCGSGFPA
jgi:acyl carrier protein